MIRKIILMFLVLSCSVSVQADFGGSVSAFLGAFFGALFGSETEKSGSYHSSHVGLKCACGESSKKKLKALTCCGTVLCESCLTSRRHTASIKKTSPKCHKCAKSFDYDTAVQKATMTSYSDRGGARRYVRPTALVLNPEENHVQKCASGCNSSAEVVLRCRGGHSMCTSCLSSRVKKARRAAFGDQPYVVCPKCEDMLTSQVISRF
jgi:hypothetical protein